MEEQSDTAYPTRLRDKCWAANLEQGEESQKYTQDMKWYCLRSKGHKHMKMAFK